MAEDTSPENLRKFLENDDPALRRMGMSLAKGSGVPEEVYKIIFGLSLWDPVTDNRQVAKRLVENIGLKNISEFPEWLEPFEENEIHGNLRPSAARALSKIGDGRVVKPLIKALEDRNKYVRRNAAIGLARTGDTRAMEPFIRMLSDEDWEVRGSATEALGEIGKPAVEQLIETLRDENSDARKSATIALGEIGDERAVEPLIKALGDDDWRVRSSAAMALRKIGDERAVEPLAEHYRKYGPKCIIFDCDGTLVDSEEVTNEIIAEMAGELGVKMTGEEATATFGGKTLGAVLYRMRELSSNEIPDDWLPRLIERVSEAWKTELNPVNGVRELLEGLEIPICVASNGEPIHINQSLQMTGLHDFFKEQNEFLSHSHRIYTASDVGIPKPAPDLFLYAAQKMGFAPSDCVIVEDSIPGVTAANRAKIKVYGLVKLCSAEELENAGAIPFTNMRDLPALLGI